MLVVRLGAAESITDGISCLLKTVEFKRNAYVDPPPLTQLITLLQEKRLCAHPFLEIYRDGQIHFMAPLARQGDFYVPEVRRVERNPLVREELHSDSDFSGIIFNVSQHNKIDFADREHRFSNH